MASARVASRYVKSLIGLAIEQQVLEAVRTDMKTFAHTCRHNKEFTRMLRSPIIRQDKKLAVIQALFQSQMHPLTLAFIAILTRKYREPLLPQIAEGFQTAYNDYKGIGTASVITATPIDESVRAELAHMVRQLVQKPAIELEERVDPSLVGGFVLNVGDQQIDASVKRALKKLNVTLRDSNVS